MDKAGAKLEETARKIIESNLYMVVSTANEAGKPWVSPVFFAYDEAYNLYWVSYTEAEHSKNIRNRKEVAIVIFDSAAPEGQGQGVYFDAEAHELTNPEEIEQAMEVLSARVTKDEFKVKSIAEVTENGVWRIYAARPKEVFILGDSYIKNQFVDKRIRVRIGVDLEKL